MDEKRINSWFFNGIFLQRVLWLSIWFLIFTLITSLLTSVLLEVSILHPFVFVGSVLRTFFNVFGLFWFIIISVASLPSLLASVKLVSCEDKKLDIQTDLVWMALFFLANLTSDLLIAFGLTVNESEPSENHQALYYFAILNSAYFSLEFLRRKIYVLQFPAYVKPRTTQAYYDFETIIIETVRSGWKIWAAIYVSYIVLGWKLCYFMPFDDNDQLTYKNFVWRIISVKVLWSTAVYTKTTYVRHNFVAKIIHLFICQVILSVVEMYSLFFVAIGTQPDNVKQNKLVTPV